MANVVIVDDQATDRGILDRLVRNVAADIDVYAFAGGGEALDWLRVNQPDMLLVDYRMPQMDGLEFIKALRDLPSCTGIPIIVITIVDDTELRYRALDAGATDFLTKPLDLQECEVRCRNLLMLRRQQLTISRHAERLAEARRRTTRALRTLSRGNELLTGARSARELLQGVCRIVSEQAGYPVVRIGLWDDTGRLHEVACRPASLRGDDTGLLTPELAELAAAIRADGEPRILDDVPDPDRDWGYTSLLSASGFGAAALLPVRIEGLTDGVLAVFAERDQRFDEDETELLARTANTLGYGLAARRAQRARDRAERDRRYLTHCDRLTGLPNRNGLLEHMRGPRDERGAAVLVVNLDRFKIVNDTTGHEVGDMLLLEVVYRLQAVVGARDLLARQSGDEFLLLVGDAPAGAPTAPSNADDRASRTAQRLIEAMQQPFRLGGYDYYIGASIGISRLDDQAGNGATALRQAHTAMQQAKVAGGNRHVIYTGELTERQTRRVSLEGRLRRAVDNGAFVLHYQPIVELVGGRAVGFEALLRWPQEDGSLLAPETFVPLAEETALMPALGQWVFESVCEQARVWEQAGFTPEISVNLSVHQLLRPRLAHDFGEVLDRFGVTAGRIGLEVTESAMMTDPARTERVLRELHERGLGIAVDDFGTGYSSLGRLKDLPISTLKIDKDFVVELPTDPADRTLVRSILQLATNMGLRAVAEGVESGQHDRVLQDLGCQLGQGYHLTPALPPDGLQAILAGASVRGGGADAPAQEPSP